jgi:hypothetical protein
MQAIAARASKPASHVGRQTEWRSTGLTVILPLSRLSFSIISIPHDSAMMRENIE